MTSMGSAHVRIRRGFYVLFSGNTASALIGLVTFALNARALGPSLLGVLTLLMAFQSVVIQLISFDTWQPVIKFGTEARAAGNLHRLRDVAVFGLAFDLFAALAAAGSGLLVAIFALGPVGIDPSQRNYAAALSISMVFGVNSACKGILRIFNAYRSLAFIQLAVSIFTLLASFVFYIVKAPFALYVLLVGLQPAVTTISVLVVTFFIWQREGLPSLFHANIGDPLLRRSFIHFSWTTSGLSSFNTIRQNVDVFLLGAALGPAVVGIYRFAAQVASVIPKVVDPLAYVIYAEVANITARGKTDILRRTVLFGVILGLLFAIVAFGLTLVFGSYAVHLVGGANYVAAAAPLAWLAFANALAANSSYVRPSMVTAVGPGSYLLASLAGGCVFLPVLWFGIRELGAMGAGIAHLIYSLVWLSVCLGILSRRLNFGMRDFATAAAELLSLVAGYARRATTKSEGDPPP